MLPISALNRVKGWGIPRSHQRWIVELLDKLLPLAHGRRAIEAHVRVVSLSTDLGKEVQRLQEEHSGKVDS